MRTLLKISALCLLIAATAVSAGAGEHGWNGMYESKFYGTVERIPEVITGTWLISGKEVIVTKETFIEEKHGKAAAGSFVEVEGNLAGKTFTAYKIEVKRAVSEYPAGAELELKGIVERVPEGLLGTWIISGQEVFVSRDTVIKEERGKAGGGAYAEVKGTRTGKTFSARKIEIKDAGK